MFIFWGKLYEESPGTPSAGSMPISPRRFGKAAILLCWTVSYALAGLFSSPWVGIGLASSDPAEWGKPVVNIRLECDARLSLEPFAHLVAQKTGEALNRDKVSQSLKSLYSTGRFTELRADARRLENGVELVFVARATYFVGVVDVEGAPDALDRRVLITASRLRLGQPIQERDLASARERLTAVLVENGYYQSELSYRVLPNPDNQVADVIFSLSPGTPASLSSVEFEGQLIVPAERLAKVCRWRPGVHLTSSRLERGLYRLHRFYEKEGRLQVTANVRRRIHNPEDNTERLVLHVEAGPLIRVRLEGAEISNSKRRELLPFFREGVVDETSLERGRQNLEDYFERRGFQSVKVEVQQNARADSREMDVTYTVNPGERGRFEGCAFRGNDHIPTAELVRLVSVHPIDFLRERGVFSRELLRQDVQALTGFYRARGFLEARVTPHLDDHYKNQPRRLFLTFEIDEGPQTTVGQLTTSGISQEMQNAMWPLLSTKPRQPFSPARADRDRELIIGYLADQGYTHASAEWEASSGASPNEVNLEYRIETGPQERIERVAVIGNEFTRTGTVNRELTFRKGEPLSQSSILESQRQLYDLGMFSQVQIAPQEPFGTETWKTLLVNVEEARRWTLGYGGGIEVQRLSGAKPEGVLKASPRLSLELSRLNVGGRAQTVTLRGRLSTLEKGGAISYLVPRFPTRRDLALRINVLVDRSRDVLTFTSRRQEASVSIEKRYSAAAILVGRYSFRRVQALDISDRISPEQIPLFSRPARIGMLSLSYANDHRDDPADATDGSYSLADAGVSWSRLGSQSNFLRVSGQNATYHRLGRHLIFARNTRLAVEGTVGQVDEGEQIPLPELFFMGGSESHRGFSINQAGPRDLKTGFPLGGNALFLNSLELRAPLAGGRLGFALFHDAGNVFSSVKRMRLLKVTQNSPTDFDYTAHAVGLGVRYRTPVGPVRFDVGYNLNPVRFQVVDPDTGTMEVRRLSHFQFFLSIGQIF